MNNMEEGKEHEDDVLEECDIEKSKDVTLELIGWAGSVLIVIAYVTDLNNLDDFIFNTVGSASLVGVCYRKKAYQPLAINAAWVVGGIYKYFFAFS